MEKYVLYDKAGNYINYYLAFDIYHKNGENFKGLPFIQSEGLKYADDNIPKDKFRWNELNMFIDKLDAKCVVLDYETPLKITTKILYKFR